MHHVFIRLTCKWIASCQSFGITPPMPAYQLIVAARTYTLALWRYCLGGLARCQLMPTLQRMALDRALPLMWRALPFKKPGLGSSELVLPVWQL